MKAANNNSECPICNQAASEKFQPFCSKRCSDIDLGRWFNGSYRVAGDKTSEVQERDDELDY
jgi:endogenous inhibitor of DNA gyrase (YacG/DUF329 family)